MIFGNREYFEKAKCDIDNKLAKCDIDNN